MTANEATDPVGGYLQSDQIGAEDRGMSLQYPVRSTIDVAVPPKAIHALMRIILIVFASLALCLACVITLAHRGKPPRIVEPPADFLPESALPAGITCDTTFYFRRFECRVNWDGEIVDLTINEDSGRIIRTTITAHGQSIGNLVAVWGTPTGIRRYPYALFVYWGTRWAFVLTCSFQPDSLIELIGYDLDNAESGEGIQSPWHGFANSRGYGCMGSSLRP